ncbi:MAG: flagellar basal body P-ring formation chaperone FlgA [Pseudomonadota bacterium]
MAHLRRILSAAALVSVAQMAAAAKPALHDPLDIRAAAVQFALQQAEAQANVMPEVQAGRLDPRLRLARCGLPLEAFRPRGGRTVGNLSVGVRCSDGRGWTVFVPVYVSLPGEVLVATRFVARGAFLEPGDVRLESRDLARLPNGYYERSEKRSDGLPPVFGMRVKRALRPGNVVTPRSLAPPLLVRRGKRVTIIAGVHGIEIRAAGKALRDGARGDIVTVQNLASRRTVEGVVSSAGVVRVRM